MYRVNRHDELGRLVAHFDQYPLQSPHKQARYRIWRAMVVLKQEFRRTSNRSEMEGLVSELATLS